MIQAANSYSRLANILSPLKKMKHSLADLPFLGSFLSVFPCRTLRNYPKIECFRNRITRTHLRKNILQLNFSDMDMSESEPTDIEGSQLLILKRGTLD